AMDDFFGYLEDHEGTALTDDLDIGIGRLTVTTPEQAEAVVDKIIRYSTVSTANLGEWRNVICFVADDEDGNLHINQAERLVDVVSELRPEMNIDKIFIDAHQQVFTPGGQRYPDVNADINSRISRGALIMNYTGHGGVNGWALERILERSDINSWRNIDHLPLFITATCEFAYYDDPNLLSAGELVLLNPKGGGIALFTTTRPTFAGPNFTLNRRIFEAIFSDIEPDLLRLGDIIRIAKSNISDMGNARKFILIGDPALKLAIPRYRVFTTHFNNSEVTFASDTLRALSMVTINGYVGDRNGQILSDFNGVVIPTVLDKAVQMTTNANDGGEKFPFQLQQNILYRGKSSVVNGAFSFSFIVPRDIAYHYGPGRISYYAFGSLGDAHGSTHDLFVGGFNENVNTDLEGPVIELYINDRNFRHGGITGENPVLFAVVSDESGINTSGSGIGHDITAILNDEPENVRVLNRYYTADLNTFQRGTIEFPFFNLPDGQHMLRLKVWDVHNNSSEAITEFVVASSATMALQQVLNAPNPFRDYTRFYLEHNMGGEEIEVDVQIFSFDGRLLKRLNQTLIPHGFRSEIATWDGHDNAGNPLEAGVYIYRVLVKNNSGQLETASNKLVIIR
ncbi:MAG TPA: type IX secretion system sortase PorU, partial [Bacteroidales bacterium]|nr:type IX secretion system sortase PorU [Bacteroidales bacterium]